MNETILKGYHSTHTDNLESIVRNGFYMSKPNAGHWLGKGVYFFVDLYYAVEWKIIGVLKKNNIEDSKEAENTCIIVANIDCESFEVVDFSVPDGYEIYKTFLEVLKDNLSSEEYEETVSKGDKYIIKALEKLEIVQGEKYLSAFDVVCADYNRDLNNTTTRDVEKDGSFSRSNQIQLCVKNLKAISNIHKFIDKEREADLLDIVKKNRRKSQ